MFPNKTDVATSTPPAASPETSDAGRSGFAAAGAFSDDEQTTEVTAKDGPARHKKKRRVLEGRAGCEAFSSSSEENALESEIAPDPKKQQLKKAPEPIGRLGQVLQLSSLILSLTGSPPPDPSPSFLCLFLFYAEGDVARAASRHADYWSLRAELFGPSLSFDVPSPSPLASHPFIATPEGACDALGRGLVYICPRFLDWSLLSLSSCLSCFWSIMHALLLTDPLAAEHGVIVVSNNAGISLPNFVYAKKLLYMAMRSVVHALPLRVSAVRIVNSPAIVNRILLPLFKIFWPEALPGWLEVLGDDHGRLLEVLPRGSVPKALGGTLEVEEPE
ncbi:hypothetical protein TeGR_g1131 [Tetraparma gracilis]|uniref:CRAL-TRIO domain-containing protein n=1 Tax=Tetraparma gracilis TaxID=2962635 RepID=A0ABQ6M8Z6_9STRA|nr:hypothetical protein TeGR_g1131 [Tetraparma gracilis]